MKKFSYFTKLADFVFSHHLPGISRMTYIFKRLSCLFPGLFNQYFFSTRMLKMKNLIIMEIKIENGNHNMPHRGKE